MSWSENLRAWVHRVKRDGVTLWFALRHPDTPWLVKGLAALVVAYALSPIDLIPDFIPVLGYLDDVLLLPILIWLAMRLIPAGIRQECQRQGDDWMNRRGRAPKSPWGIAFVLVVWLLAIGALWVWWRSG